MKPLEVWTCQRAENLKKSSKIPKNNYAATMVSAARRQIIGGGTPINKRRRRRPQIVGGGAHKLAAAARSCRCTALFGCSDFPASQAPISSKLQSDNYLYGECFKCFKPINK